MATEKTFSAKEIEKVGLAVNKALEMLQALPDPEPGMLRQHAWQAATDLKCARAKLREAWARLTSPERVF